jgi:hypothetical protein
MDSKDLVLEKEAQHTPEEILKQMVEVLVVAAHNQMLTMAQVAAVVNITRELIHWAFIKPGGHATPAEMLSAALFARGVAEPAAKDGKLKFDA